MRRQDGVSYQRALKFLYRRTNYETFKSIPYSQMANSLARLREFLKFLGNPERRFVSICVAGTKGKGTTCAAIERIYESAGVRVGLFTSPHLDELTERFRIDGRECDKLFFAETLFDLVERWKQFSAQKTDSDFGGLDFNSEPPLDSDEHPLTFFEWTFLLAVALFARADVDVAVFEVGLGGRFDATNALDADLSVLTSVSYDHCELLGNSLLEIANEKLGIVKTSAPLVCGVGLAKRWLKRVEREEDRGSDPVVQEEVPEKVGRSRLKTEFRKKGAAELEDALRREKSALWNLDPQTIVSEEELDEVLALARERARANGAPFYDVSELSPFVESLPEPPFDPIRKWNFEIALNVVSVLSETRREGARALPVSEEAIRKAAERLDVPARLEIVSRNPTVIVDGAHNRASVAAVMNVLRERYRDKKLRVLFASTIGKDQRGMIAEIAPLADEVVLTQRSKDSRAAPISDLIQIAEEVLDETCAEDSSIRRKFHVAPDFRAFLADRLTRPSTDSDVWVALGSFYFAAEVRQELRSR